MSIKMFLPFTANTDGNFDFKNIQICNIQNPPNEHKTIPEMLIITDF